MSDQLPGVDHIDLHEGRLTGPFDLLRSDMTQIGFGRRVMICVVADVLMPLTIVETKDGDLKAKWTIKPIDVAFVRDEEMQQHLSDTLHMISIDPSDEEQDDDELTLSSTLIGQYDDEGAFVGMAREVDLESEPVLGDEDVPDIDHGEHPDRPEAPLFKGRSSKPGDGPTPPRTEQVETYGRPVERSDKHLASFLDERVPA